MIRTTISRFTMMAALSIGLAFSACSNTHDSADKRSEVNDPEQAGSNSQATVPSATDTGMQNATPPNTANTMDDATIMGKMMATDEMEMSMGNRARMKGQNAEVKALAKMIEDDHTKMLTQAEDLATKLALNPVMPPPDPMMEQAMVALGNASGATFDSMFVAMNIQGHEKTLADLATMQGVATKQEVKDLIAAAIPVIQKHLDRAKQIQGSIGGGHSGNVSGAVK